MPSDAPETLVRQGKLAEALAALQQQVRDNPADPKKRVFLFQIMAVMGNWERALVQLAVAAEMDPGTLLMAQVCRQAINCEALRAEVFEGKRLPTVFGQPAEWVGWLVQANQLSATGQFGPARELRDRAFEAAPAVAGSIDGKPFEWIADSDVRLGPVLEAIIEGRYYWVPFQHVRELSIDKPADLRDVVWLPATFTWDNGGSSPALIPTRYPGSESSADPAIQMARKTEWVRRDEDFSTGLGQRMFATDQDEYPLLETRRIVLGANDGQANSQEQQGSPEVTHG